jgi:60 kDa SS-A/Ro ribonucleoprotein
MAEIYSNYASSSTPQTQPIAGRETAMLTNNAGGYGFVLDDWERLHRFLILGSEGGHYYTSEQKLTAENAAAVLRCIAADGMRVVREAATVNINNLAPKVDSQLFVLALALRYGDRETKRFAQGALPDMLRIGTHVLHFAAMLNSLGGWSRVKRRVIARWFEDRTAGSLAFQALKYANRDGWSMRDLLRLAHPGSPTPQHAAVYRWICGHSEPEDKDLLPPAVQAHTTMQVMTDTPVEKALYGIRANLPREVLPTEALADASVWHALLPQMPIHALLRNLGNLSAHGTLRNGAPEVATVAAMLTDRKTLREARVHPFAILLASLVYQRGRGVRGSNSWPVIPGVVAALETAYDMAFETVTPTNRRLLIAVDISASMDSPCIGTPIMASTAAAAMAITLARAEPNAVVVRFDTRVQDVVPITPRSGISSLENSSGSGTDLGATVRWALGEADDDVLWWQRVRAKVGIAPPLQVRPVAVFDAIILLTDNETWAGRAHLSELLRRYRSTVSPGVKLAVCAMTASHASVVDPDDPLSLGCCGLDANLPGLIRDFIER